MLGVTHMTVNDDLRPPRNSSLDEAVEEPVVPQGVEEIFPTGGSDGPHSGVSPAAHLPTQFTEIVPPPSQADPSCAW